MSYMGCTSAVSSYSPDQIKVSKVARAIAHPARIAILQLLNVKTCTCNDIVSQLPLAQSTVSQHLKELQKVKLIHGVEKPPKTFYTLNKPVYDQMQVLLNSFFSS
jgi:DNA-binding transcriptional ArsR family regulator